MSDDFSCKQSGNALLYNVENTEALRHSPLSGKMFFFLGSSVTLGSASEEQSVTDFLSKKHTCNVIKEAISGTTLADIAPNSYVNRLEKHIFSGKALRPDVFLCQLSTNDATRSVNSGTMTPYDVKDITAFDRTTTLGAIEWIIASVKTHWQCPILFFTNSYFESDRYARLTGNLLLIAEKWKIDVLDLFHSEDFNCISDEERRLFMADAIHPTKAGYREWWLPEFEKRLENICAE